MKNYLITLFLMMISAINCFADNISIADVCITGDEISSVDVSFNNSSSNIVAVQFNLTLPEGIEPVSENGKVIITPSARLIGDYTLRGSKVADGSYLFIFVSQNRNPITGNSGTLFSFNVKKISSQDGNYTAIVSDVLETNIDGYETSLDDTSFAINISTSHKLIYKVDGEIYKTVDYFTGTAIIPEPEPMKEGYTFSGWSEIPATMPAYDVEVNGSFTINEYKLTYMVDGELYYEEEIVYGTAITPLPEPTREGETFSGWSDIPLTMPSHDVTITGTFATETYILTYKVDGDIYNQQRIAYGEVINPLAAPIKEGYTFSGWSDIPATMPAHDVEVNGTFSINQYIITFIVDVDVVYKQQLDYGSVIVRPDNPSKEGYTFTGWNPEVPETVPAMDMTFIAQFDVNIYKVQYFVGEDLVHEDEVAYGDTFELWSYNLEDDDLIFNGWIGEKYDTMPAHDILYKADITSGIAYIVNNPENVQDIYTLDGKKVEKIHQGVNIIRNADGTLRKVLKK